MHRIDCGRLFIRSARAQARGYDTSARRQTLNESMSANGALLLGVVQVPVSADVERMHNVRLNSALWMDVDSASQPLEQHHDLRETAITDVLTAIAWRTHLLPDTFDVFLRATALSHQDSSKRWAFIAAALPHRLEALPQDGLYEFDANDGFRHINGNTFNGDALQSVLREPMWGPNGKYGFAHSLEPNTYPGWLTEERRRNKDPLFARFTELMEAEMPLQLVYDAEHHAARDKMADQVLRRLMAGDAANDLATTVPAPRRARP